MPRYTPAPLPPGSAPPNVRPKQQEPVELPAPLEAGVLLGHAVRDEHGREGVRAYVSAINPLLPRALIEQLAAQLGVSAPPPAPPVILAGMQHAAPPQEPPPKPPQKETPAIPPELLLQLLQGTGGGGGGSGFDPSMLLKLLQK